MALPNFLVIGAPKAGTTSIYRYLAQHPDIFMSPAKEPNFFAFGGEEPSFQGPGDLDEPTVTTLADYEALFAEAGTQTARGEASTVYLYSSCAAERIHAQVPAAKLIAILRNPVDRAFSNYLHLRRSGRESIESFRGAIAAEPKRIANNWKPFWFYQAQGFYYQQLQQYLQYFPREQLGVWLFGDLKKSPQHTLQEIFQFLGVDPTFTPNTAEKVRVTPPVAKNQVVDHLFNQPNVLKRLVKPLLPSSLRRRVASQVNQRNKAKPQVSAAMRQQLIAAYRDDILQLQDWLGRDLSSWLKP